jgi:hypothetical protein
MSDEKVILTGDEEIVRRASARRTRRSFVVGGVAAAAGYGAWRWINHSKPIGRLQGVLRRALEVDADVNRAIWDERGLAPTYPLSRAVPLRLNGMIGLDLPLKLNSWRLQMVGVEGAESLPLYVKDVTSWQYEYGENDAPSELAPDYKTPPPEKAAPEKLRDPTVPQTLTLAERFDQMSQQITGKRYQGDAEAGPSANSLNIGTPGLLLAMSDLMKLPKVELVTEFKCIEGWSQITQWAGVRLRDLIEMYPPQKIKGHEPRFVYMETPDGNYYAGYDMAAARHPQSLLVTEMSGQPIAMDHGAPLRLHMPIKYGYKQIKRIGLIAYTDAKPDDFWAKLGYDWYAGL